MKKHRCLRWLFTVVCTELDVGWKLGKMPNVRQPMNKCQEVVTNGSLHAKVETSFSLK